VWLPTGRFAVGMARTADLATALRSGRDDKG
jgi:hypothetical protein